MKSLILVASAALFSLGVAHADAPKSYDDVMAEVRAAFAAEDWPAVTRAVDAAQAMRPYSLFLTRNRILARAMSGDVDGALAIVREIAEQGVVVGLDGHPGYSAVRAHADFPAIEARMKDNLAPRGAARLVLELPDPDLLPEAYAVDSRGGVIATVRTGAFLAAGGETIAKAPGGAYGLELRKARIHAVVNSAPPYFSPTAPAVAGLYAVDRASGAVLSRAEIKDGSALFGALVTTPRGIVVSDSRTPRLFVERDGELLEFARDPRFANLQGLAYDSRRKALFVADYLVGIFRIDMKTGEAVLLSNPSGAWLGGIDGLYLYKGDLVGVQNGSNPQRIVRLALDRKGGSVVGLQVVQQALSEWSEPTNGQIVGDELHYVGTSNWPAYADDGSVRDGARRAPVRVLAAPLR